VDPISLLFAAKACFSAIQQGTALYKQCKESFMEVKSTIDEAVGAVNEVRSFWSKLFGSKPAAKQPVQQTRKKEKYVAIDETEVKVQIVKSLTEFFKLQEQLAAHIREEEEKSKNVYDPDQNLMEAALNRVMVQQEFDALVVQIREIMVFQAPSEMGALYSEVFSMREKIGEEQTQARLKEEAKNRQELWQRREEERNFQLKVAYLVATTTFLLYLWLWLLFVSQLRKT
jgi:hypothetical protein